MGNYGNDLVIEHFEMSRKRFLDAQKKLSSKNNTDSFSNDYEFNKLISLRAKRIASMSKQSVISYDAKVNSRKLGDFL